MISGWGRSAGAVIPALGSGRYSPGPNIVLPSWLQGSDPHCTLNVFWGQPGALATVSQIVETVHDKLQHTFRLDRERPHALSGLQARLAAKMAVHNFCMWLN